MPEQKQFEAEARQLLHLVIHSLYSNRDIVLRELISNASDAIDKLRFESIAKPELIDAETTFEIRVDTEAAMDDAPARLIVSDNGIGMSAEEAIANLGVIAKSGTAEFLKGLTGDEKKDSALIGQFGVGFYSSFILADEVRVVTRRAGQAPEEATLWRSSGEGGYTVEPATREAVGTTVTLDLKQDAEEFATPFKIRELVRRFSDHITVPVLMPEPVSTQSDKESDKEEDDAPEPAWEQVNSAEALWTRPRKEVSDDDHKDFYKHVFHDFLDPLCWSHNRVEGRLEYTSLLYIPRQAPMDLYLRESNRGVRLYVQRVFIMDEAKHFLPLYLRFVRGVLDCNDLPLNVSREMLQDDPRVESIRKALSKRVLSRLETLAKESPDDFKLVWTNFGRLLKEGAAEDQDNRAQLLKLLRFASTESSDADALTSLEDYVSRMKEGQSEIYWVSAESIDMARSSPHLEALKARGFEVLLLGGAGDEWLMAHLDEFDGKRFRDVSRGGLDLPGDDAENPEKEDAPASDDGLLERLKTSLGDTVNEVLASDRLVDSAACLVLGEHEYGIQLRRYLEATGSPMPDQSPTLEVNLKHPLMLRLSAVEDDAEFDSLAMIAFEHACLASGAPLSNPAEHVQRVTR
ncbi:MAG: molecular chaperone HtpG, partial [Gammaproteobacteria bacterium]|nr:molecular chaperone HtpG [Gammaproteobacteria bacterium]